MSGSRRSAPFQFGLRSVLIGMLIAAGVFAVWRGLGPIWGPATVWLVLLAAAHTVGNAWGRRNFARPVRLPHPQPKREGEPGNFASGPHVEAPAQKEPADSSRRAPETMALPDVAAETAAAQANWTTRSFTRGERRVFGGAIVLGAALGAGLGWQAFAGEPTSPVALNGALVACASLAALGAIIAGVSVAAAPTLWRIVRRVG